MREPRSKQRFPQGGKELYELMRMDYEPDMITIYPVGDITPQRARCRGTLCYETALDPMLYFWPVEKAHAIVWVKAMPADEDLERLAKALLRDGARIVTVIWNKKATPDDVWTKAWRHWGDIDSLIQELAGAQPVAVPGGRDREDREGADALAPDHRELADGKREDAPRLDPDPQSPLSW